MPIFVEDEPLYQMPRQRAVAQASIARETEPAVEVRAPENHTARRGPRAQSLKATPDERRADAAPLLIRMDGEGTETEPVPVPSVDGDGRKGDMAREAASHMRQEGDRQIAVFA